MHYLQCQDERKTAEKVKAGKRIRVISTENALAQRPEVFLSFLLTNNRRTGVDLLNWMTCGREHFHFKVANHI